MNAHFERRWGCRFLVLVTLLLLAGPALATDVVPQRDRSVHPTPAELAELEEALQKGEVLGGDWLKKAKDRLLDAKIRHGNGSTQLERPTEVIPGMVCTWDDCKARLEEYKKENACCWCQIPCCQRQDYTKRANQIDSRAQAWRGTVQESRCCLWTLYDGWRFVIDGLDSERQAVKTTREADDPPGPLQVTVMDLIGQRITFLKAFLEKTSSQPGLTSAERTELEKRNQATRDELEKHQKRLEEVRTHEGWRKLVATKSLEEIGYYLEMALEVQCPYSTVEKRLAHCLSPEGNSVPPTSSATNGGASR